MRIDNLKYVFTNSRSVDSNINEKYFNYFKFYIMIYFVNFIRLYKSANDFDIKYMKIAYKFLIKNYYSRINKNEDF